MWGPSSEPLQRNLIEHIVNYMKQVIVELDDEILRKLEEVAPARSRKRSEFIRLAVRKALWEIEEKATQDAYARQPESGEPIHFDPELWDGAGDPK